MLFCVIRYHIDPTKKQQFTEFPKNWGQRYRAAVPTWSATSRSTKDRAPSPTAFTKSKVLPNTKPIARDLPTIRSAAKTTSSRNARNSCPAKTVRF